MAEPSLAKQPAGARQNHQREHVEEEHGRTLEGAPPFPSSVPAVNEEFAASLLGWLAHSLAAEREVLNQEMKRYHATVITSLQKQMQVSTPPQMGPSGATAAVFAPPPRAKPSLPRLAGQIPGKSGGPAEPHESPAPDSADQQQPGTTKPSIRVDVQGEPNTQRVHASGSRGHMEVFSPKSGPEAHLLGKAEYVDDNYRTSSTVTTSWGGSSTTETKATAATAGVERAKSTASAAFHRDDSLRQTSSTVTTTPATGASPSGKRHSLNNFMSSLTVQKTKTGPVPNLGLVPLTRAESEETTWLGCLTTFVLSPTFEMIMAVVIMLNAALLAVHMQYYGLDLGFDLGYRWYHQSAADTWPGAERIFKALDYFFGVVFTLEIIVKLAGLRLAWFKDCWNIVDLFIILIWYAEIILTATGSNTEDMPIQASFLRTARLARLQRLLRLVKTIEGFDDLYLMTTTLKGSVSVLAWSCVLLLLLQILIALAINELLTAFYFNDTFYPLQERKEVFAYFGTFSRSMLTMFEMTLANWPPVCRLLQEYVNEWFVVFCVIHKLTIGFAVIGVINGVFMQETFSVASTDDRIMLKKRQRQLKSETKKLLRLMRAADDSGDGFVDREEFKRITSYEEVRLWLGSMGLDVSDADAVFTLVDVDGDGQLSAQELVSGITKLKGAARSIDVSVMMRQQKAMSRVLQCELDIPMKASTRTSRMSLPSRRNSHGPGAADALEEEVEELWRDASTLPNNPRDESLLQALHNQTVGGGGA